jgi:hypothetical protein
MTPEKLRMLEFAVLGKLGFKVGDSNEGSTVSRSHEIAIVALSELSIGD